MRVCARPSLNLTRLKLLYCKSATHVLVFNTLYNLLWVYMIGGFVCTILSLHVDSEMQRTKFGKAHPARAELHYQVDVPVILISS